MIPGLKLGPLIYHDNKIYIKIKIRKGLCGLSLGAMQAILET